MSRQLDFHSLLPWIEGSTPWRFTLRMAGWDAVGMVMPLKRWPVVGAFFLPTRYGFYYLGVAELSSVPMTVFDQAERAVEIAPAAPASHLALGLAPAFTHAACSSPDPRLRPIYHVPADGSAGYGIKIVRRV